MAENLRATQYNDGTPIANITDNTAWANTTSAAYSYYDHDDANKIPNRLYINFTLSILQPMAARMFARKAGMF